MIWLLYALGAALARGTNSVLHRKIVVGESSLSYAFLLNFVTGLMFIPFLVMEFALPTKVLPWILVFVSSVLWAVIGVVGLKSIKMVHVSIREPIFEIKLIMLLILSAVFLREVFTLEKALGTFVIFMGFLVLYVGRRTALFKLSDVGIQLTVLAALLVAIVSIIDKYAMNFFTAGTYGFLVFFVPGLFLSFFAFRRKSKLESLVRNKLKTVIVVTILAALFYFLTLKAYELVDVSIAFPIIRISTLLAVLGGIIFLGERENIVRKIVATLIVLVGVVLVSGYFNLF